VETRRSAGPAAQAADSTVSLPNRTVLDLYPDLLKELPVGVVLLRLEDPSDAKTFKIVDANPAAAEMTGTTTQMLLGRTLADFPKLLEIPIPPPRLSQLRPGEQRDLGEISYGDECIRQGIYSVRLLPLSGNFLGVAFENITDRKLQERLLRESEERSRLLIQEVQEYAIFQLDRMGYVVSWNAGAARLKGYAAEEIIGKHFSVFYPQEDLNNEKPLHILEQAARHGQSEHEGWRIRKDGSRFWANVVISALHDPNGTLIGFAKLTRDMTERRDREEALTKANELLELRVQQRTAVLTRVNQELRTEIAERAGRRTHLHGARNPRRARAGLYGNQDGSCADWPLADQESDSAPS